MPGWGSWRFPDPGTPAAHSPRCVCAFVEGQAQKAQADAVRPSAGTGYSLLEEGREGNFGNIFYLTQYT